MFTSIDKVPFAQAQSIAWQFLLAARNLHLDTDPQVTGLTFDESSQEVVPVDNHHASACLWLRANQWCCSEQLPRVLRTIFDLYIPVLGSRSEAPRVVAHLGQSIDGCIATLSGDSYYVTGEENRTHLHCLRALSDAVIIGAGTALADDPQLTTRAVPGRNPVRIVIDPQARLPSTLGICDDGQAKTILLHQSSADLSGKDLVFGPAVPGEENTFHQQVERWVIPDTNKRMSPRTIVRFLASRGMRRLFVEGGGITVSKFLEDSAVHRLHVAVAPLLVGQGIHALQLPGSDTMANAQRPPHAIYRMGDDVLWDFDVDVQGEADTNNVTRPGDEDGTQGFVNVIERIR